MSTHTHTHTHNINARNCSLRTFCEKILTSQGKLTWVVNGKAVDSKFKLSFKITMYISLKDTEEDIYHLPHYGTC